MKNETIENVSRRSFLKTSGTLVLAASLPTMDIRALPRANAFNTSVYLDVAANGDITVTAHRVEMGQGIRTALAQIVADELEADWNRVSVAQADGDAKYGDQNTDGSQSIRLFYDVLRNTGASAKEMLMQAGAQHWSVPIDEISAENHRIHHKPTARSLDYGDLTGAASKLPVPEQAKFKPRKDHKFIGKGMLHVDTWDVVKGKATYGADVKLPNMLYATAQRCPWVGGGVKTVTEPETKRRNYVGFEVFEPKSGPYMYNPLGSVVALAKDSFTAMEMAKAMQVEWTDSPNSSFDSQSFTSELASAAKNPGEKIHNAGDVDAVFERKSGKQLEALYETPFLSHAPMEPPVAVADFSEDSVEVWAPVQDPQTTRGAVAAYLGMPVNKIHIHPTMLGGAFGRKSKPDFVMEAVELSRRRGVPVRVQWTRECDLGYDYFHAASAQYFKAEIDNDGMPSAWLQRTAFPTIMSLFAPGAEQPAPWELEMGFSNLPYQFPNQRMEFTGIRPGVRIGWMRSVTNIFHAFSANSFVDELADLAGENPIDYRIKLMGDINRKFVDPNPNSPPGHEMDLRRLAGVLRRVEKLSDFHRDRGEGRGLGLAIHHSFRSYVATVIDVEVQGKDIKVHDAYVVLDCGTHINPDTCVAQMEGAVVFGLSLALKSEITFDKGSAVQGNLDTYELIRMMESPRVTVDLVQSEALPAGVGEPGVPPVAPALTNAIFAASGQRIRKLPVSLA